jgi:hypothetical protein
MQGKKVLLVELNEVTWSLIDPLIEAGKLPTFARLKEQGTWASPVSVDMPPYLDPWITWTTIYTGRPQAEHNVFFLQQSPETIHARRLWEICKLENKKVGVYGSLCSWPPQSVDGFYIPDTFASDAATWPEDLRAIQELNLTYTRSIRLPADQDTLRFKVKLGFKLLSLGLKPATVARILSQLLSERSDASLRWKRVALQPIVNFDFFSKLYRRYQPDFASFHTNHVAHYMHTYWKAMNPKIFPQPTTQEEIDTYGSAIEHGYRAADELLSKMMRLRDKDTVLIVASSMGQQPYITDLKKGKRIGQLRSLDHLMEIVGAAQGVRTLSTMSDQFNLYPDSEGRRDFLMKALQSAYIDSPERPMFSVYRVDNDLTVTLCHYDETSEDSRCYFPNNGETKSFRFEELVYGTGLVKSGFHHPKGVLMMFGPDVPRGSQIRECDNLDIAPTILSVLGIPVPSEMKGSSLLG